MTIYMNGKFVPKEKAVVSVFDHGYLYGDGAFEGIRAYNGLVFRLEEHIDRLYETMHTMMIDAGMTKKQMMKAVVDTLKANKLKDGYIRLIVSRGDGDLGLDPKKCNKGPNVIIIAGKITLYPEELYEKGMPIITVPTMRNNPNALDPQLKSMNYLNNIMAKIEATSSGYNEAIMLDSDGYVAECTGDNIFIIKKGQLITPSTGRLIGITRDAVMDIAVTKKMQVVERRVTRHEVYNAEECFLTGTAAEIIPIISVDGRVIGDGKPGKNTWTLIKAFRLLTKTDGVKYSIS